MKRRKPHKPKIVRVKSRKGRSSQHKPKRSVPKAKPTIKYFYINLDKATGRREHIEEQLAKHNIKATRFAAIDGSKVYPKKWTKKGSKACRDSHLTLWNQIGSNEIYIIFEDDIEIKENRFEKVLASIKKRKWSFCNFGKPNQGIVGTLVQDCIRQGTVTKELGKNSGLWAYAINGKYIKELLDIFQPPYCLNPGKARVDYSYIDVQLRERLNKFTGYFYSGPAFVEHRWIGKKCRNLIDKNKW